LLLGYISIIIAITNNNLAIKVVIACGGVRKVGSNSVNGLKRGVVKYCLTQIIG
jgi:hypothetical protein